MRIFLAAPVCIDDIQPSSELLHIAGVLEKAGYTVACPSLLISGQLLAREGYSLFYRYSRINLRFCKMVAAMLDDSDESVAWALGFARALRKPVVGYRSEAAYCRDIPGNTVPPPIAESCASIVTSPDSLVAAVRMAMLFYE